jgi:Mg2+-importing ATPase
LLEKSRADADTVLKALGSQLGGLSEAEASSRLKQVGTNEIGREKHQSALMRLLSNLANPLVLLLMALAVLSFLTGDLRATVVIFVMVVLGVVLRFFQEMRADNAAEKLRAMVSNTAAVVRDGKDAEVSLKMLVPGDIIRLAAGDMVPGDARVLSAKDLFLNQAALTGEALPVEKKAAPASADVQNPLELPNICFLGSNVVSGSATAVVIHTRTTHVIRTNKIPFIQSWASWPLIVSSVIIVAVGAWLIVSPLAATLGFVSLPPLYWLYLAMMLLGYAILTQIVKTWFIHRFGE